MTDADGAITYTYDPAGRVKTMAYPNGVAELYAYDAAGQLLELTQRNPDGTTELLNRFTYDPAGNILSNAGYGANNIKFELATSKYNEMNQLVTKTIRSMVGAITNDITYTYDKRGNLVKETDSKEGTVKTYEYDETNKMVRGVNVYGDESAYVYNGLGILVQHTGTITSDYVIDYTNPVDTNLAAYGSDGIDYRYTYGVGLSKIAATVTSPTDTLKLYIQNDRLGSGRFATNMAGTRVAYTSLDEWGNRFGQMKAQLNGADLKILDNFTNHDYDEILEVYYAKARFYDPAIRRFLAVDPARDGFNWYAYAGNNPIKYVDPLGIYSFGDWWNDWKTGIGIIKNDPKGAVSTLGEIFTVENWRAGLPTEPGASILCMRADENGIYHADFNAWQAIGGYNSFYDLIFDTFTSMEANNFVFNYEGQDLNVWLWKGDYINLGAGAEMGIYKRFTPFGIKTEHWLVDKSLAISMELSLKTIEGITIFDYKPNGKQWWITGFNPKYRNVNAEELIATYTLKFGCENKDMYKAFKDSLSSNNRRGWEFDDTTYIATFVFGKERG